MSDGELKPVSIGDVGERLGVSRATTDKILADIRANRAKLDACTRPHEFQRDHEEPNPLRAKWVCSICGGRVDSIWAKWYRMGIDDARKALR